MNTKGFDEVVKANKLSLEEASKITGVPAAKLKEQVGAIARMLKIDNVRDKYGTEFAEEITGGRPFGVPFFAFYDADRNMLIDSRGPTGNIGYMTGYEGKRHFRRMLQKVQQSFSDTEIEQIVSSIED